MLLCLIVPFGSLYWPATCLNFISCRASERLYRSLLENSGYIDLSWKIAHGVLLYDWAFVIFRIRHFYCVLSQWCHGITIALLNCPLAKSAGIDWIQSQFFLVSPLAPSISLRHLLFGFSADELVVVPRVFVYLRFVLKYCIWSQRNDFRFNSVAPSAIGLLASAKARVRFHRYLPVFFSGFALIPDAVIFFVSGA